MEIVKREIKPQEQSDPLVVKFLSHTLNRLGLDAECTKMLTNAHSIFPERHDITELLLFAYLTQGNLLECQNLALDLHKQLNEPRFALYAV